MSNQREWGGSPVSVRQYRPVELDISEEDLAVFAGPNGTNYVNYLRKCKDVGRLKSGFIWGGFFFTVLWLAYRRFYTGMVIYILISVIPLMSLVGSIYVAMRGRAMVLGRAQEAVSVADRRSLTGPERYTFLARKGKPSWLAATFTFVILTIIVFFLLGLSAVQDAKELANESGASGQVADHDER
jgi:hypothetical protein